jgi:hypothetical protein
MKWIRQTNTHAGIFHGIAYINMYTGYLIGLLSACR